MRLDNYHIQFSLSLSLYIYTHIYICIYKRRRSAAARLLGFWVRIPPAALMSVCCECCVLSGTGVCDELITRPEESYLLWYVVVCALETSRMRRPWSTGGCCAIYIGTITHSCGPGQRNLYSDSLRAGRPVDRIPVGARLSARVLTGPGDRPAFSKMGKRCHSRGQSGCGLSMATHLHLAPRLKEEQSYTYNPPLGLHGFFQCEL